MSTSTAQGSPKARSCTEIDIPVAMSQGWPASEKIHGRLCVPAGVSPRIIQVLVHGITYDGGYWEFPDPSGGTDRYNYAAAANKAGYATLAIDRVGSGRSSRPLSTMLTIDSNAYTVHQVVQAIRSGEVTNPSGKRFTKIVYVGHSYGTWTGWNEVTTYRDVDAAVFTAAFEELSFTAPLIVLPSTYPAAADPRFAGKGLDPGYLTTLPGTRRALFYDPAPVDPAVIAHDEATKQTVAATEIANYPSILNRKYQITVPTLLVAGTNDSLFCREYPASFPPLLGGIGALGTTLGDLVAPHEDTTAGQTQDVVGSRLGAANCDTPRALVDDERAHLGNPPQLDAYILDGAGHDLNQALDARDYFAAVNSWIRTTLGPGAR